MLCLASSLIMLCLTLSVLTRLSISLIKSVGIIFWGRDKKIFPVAWDSICAPKKMGGLGVRRLDHFNNACLAKLGWKVMIEEDN